MPYPLGLFGVLPWLGVGHARPFEPQARPVIPIDQNGSVDAGGKGDGNEVQGEELPVFVVKGWSGQIGVRNSSTMSTSVLETGGVVESSLMSMAIAHRDEQGRRIAIWSHRPDDRSELKQWAPVNTVLAWLRSGPGSGLSARKFNRLAEKIQTDIVERRRPWTRTCVIVDDHEVDFELMEFDELHWAAVAYLDEVYITIDSIGVPVADWSFDARAPATSPKAPVSRRICAAIRRPTSVS